MPIDVICSCFAKRGADVFIIDLMGGRAADFDQGVFLGYWGGGEQARSGGVENMGDLAWSQGKSTGDGSEA